MHFPVPRSIQSGLLLIAMTTGAVRSPAHHPQAADAGGLADGEPDQSYDEQEEAFVRTPPGFATAGRWRVTNDDAAAEVRVTVVDAETGLPTACRVNVVGPDGNFYGPNENHLESYGATGAGCHLHRESHAPSRYFGWYFYTTGNFTVRTPPGQVRVEVFKGYEFRPVRQTVQVAAKSTKNVRIAIARTVPMRDFSYYSGDTHVHLNRRSETEESHALDLMAAEDIAFGFVLCMNDPAMYSGVMDRQEWPQDRGFGAASVVVRNGHGIASAQEYRSKSYGHICLLMHDRLVLGGATVDPNNWPVFGMVGERTRQLGGYSFHAHGGYAKEIYADYAQGATDGVELLQMAHYRGIGLTGWYRILNVGYRFPALAGSDFPYTRALGDCRTYVHADGPLDFAGWARGAAQGQSFFTTGPLLLMEVDGARPGARIDIAGRPSNRLRVRLKLRCEVTSMDRLELIVNGETRHGWTIPRGPDNAGKWHERELELSIKEPSWIAARAFGISPTGRSDAEAHTNPVYVDRGDERPFDANDLEWLIERLDDQITALERRSFAEQEQALEFFRESRRQLVARRR